ncbi:MAG TPA: GNAT family N-acetyltransferase [Solirubrobacterales bacterium]|nr:GNAT family N-acetyltransferase [Solirubrobacterales bacterium]
MQTGDRQTDRLLLRQPSRDDRALYHAHFTHPEIERWLRPPPLPPFNAGAIEELVEGDQAHWSNHGFGPWVLIEKNSGAFAGRGGLHWTTVEDTAAIELAWSVEPALHNRGYATETAQAAIKWARELQIEELVALVLSANTPSRRVAEKSGFEPDGEVAHAGLPHLLFRLRLRDAVEKEGFGGR